MNKYDGNGFDEMLEYLNAPGRAAPTLLLWDITDDDGLKDIHKLGDEVVKSRGYTLHKGVTEKTLHDCYYMATDYHDSITYEQLEKLRMAGAIVSDKLNDWVDRHVKPHKGPLGWENQGYTVMVDMFCPDIVIQELDILTDSLQLPSISRKVTSDGYPPHGNTRGVHIAMVTGHAKAVGYTKREVVEYLKTLRLDDDGDPATVEILTKGVWTAANALNDE